MAKKTTVQIFKDAGSGKFVSKNYADKHPKTTYQQTIKRPTQHKKNNSK